MEKVEVIQHNSVVGVNILEVVEAGMKSQGVAPGSIVAQFIHEVLTGQARLVGLPEKM